MWHGLTVKQLGLLPTGKQINLKKKSLLVHKEVKLKTNEMLNECFYICKLELVKGFLLVPRTLRYLSRAICSPAPSPYRLANIGWRWLLQLSLSGRPYFLLTL